jgi:hypothetical protein
MHVGVIRSRPTAYRKVTIQHNHLNRKNIIQNRKKKCKNNIKLVYLNFMHCTCKFEKHKQSFVSENYEQTFPNEKPKQTNASEKHKQSFPSENYNRTFHNESINKSFVVAS